MICLFLGLPSANLILLPSDPGRTDHEGSPGRDEAHDVGQDRLMPAPSTDGSPPARTQGRRRWADRSDTQIVSHLVVLPECGAAYGDDRPLHRHNSRLRQS